MADSRARAERIQDKPGRMMGMCQNDTETILDGLLLIKSGALRDQPEVKSLESSQVFSENASCSKYAHGFFSKCPSKYRHF